VTLVTQSDTCSVSHDVDCTMSVTASCPAGTAIVGCTGYPDTICILGSTSTSGTISGSTDGSVGVYYSYFSGNSCVVEYYNVSGTDRSGCGSWQSNFITEVECLNTP
jgi:hypothetical protein